MINTLTHARELALHVVKQLQVPDVAASIFIVKFASLKVNFSVNLIFVDVWWPYACQFDLFYYSESIGLSQGPCYLIEGQFNYHPVFISEDARREGKHDFVLISIVRALSHHMYNLRNSLWLITKLFSQSDKQESCIRIIEEILALNLNCNFLVQKNKWRMHICDLYGQVVSESVLGEVRVVDAVWGDC